MTIGIIGAGSIGAAVARRLAQANIPTILSNSHGPDSLTNLVSDIGASIFNHLPAKLLAEDPRTLGGTLTIQSLIRLE